MRLFVISLTVICQVHIQGHGYLFSKASFTTTDYAPGKYLHLNEKGEK